MNWLIFILAAYLMYALEIGLGTLLKCYGATPSFLLVLAVFIGTLAPQRTCVWAFLILGVLVDIKADYTSFTVIGPGALGYLVGAYAVIQLRSLVFRESVITLSVLSFCAGIFIHLVMIALLMLRGLMIFTGEPIGLRAAEALELGFLQLVYTAVLAIPVGWLLLRTRSVWHFHSKGRIERYY